MSNFFYTISVPFAILNYTLLFATVIIGILKYKLHVNIKTLIHRILAGISLLLASLHGGFHLYWNNGNLTPQLTIGMIPYVLLIVNIVLGLSKLNTKVKMTAHMWVGIFALIIASFHAGWMLYIRYSF